jgi:hypothetical protein
MAKKSKATEPVAVSEFQLTGGAKIIGYEDGSFKFFPAPIEISAENVAAIFGGKPDSDSDEEDEEGVSIEDMKAALIESGLTKKKVNKMSNEEVEEAYGELETEEEEDEEEDSDEDEDEEDSDDEEEDEVSIEDMKAALIESGMAKKKVNKMTDEEIEEAYEELEGDDDEDEEDSDDDDDEDSDEDEEDSDDDDDSDDSDEDEDDDEEEEELTGEALAEMDFEEIEDVCDEKDLDTDPDDFEDVEKLRAAVAKELGISLPKKAKGKKGK